MAINSMSSCFNPPMTTDILPPSLTGEVNALKRMIFFLAFGGLNLGKQNEKNRFIVELHIELVKMDQNTGAQQNALTYWNVDNP